MSNGNTGKKRTPAQCENMRRAKLLWYKDHPDWLPDESRQRMADAHRGKTLTAEHKRKISESMMGNKNPLNNSPSAATREKLSKIRKQEYRSGVRTKAIQNNDMFSGELESIFEDNILKRINNINYTHQEYLPNVGFVDFVVDDYKIIIECDEPHHAKAKQKNKDMRRDLNAKRIYGYNTIRFNEDTIINHPDICIIKINNILAE